MDSLIVAAGRALAVGNPLAALDRIALREDPPALALRGIAMAQLGDFARALALLERARRAFEPGEVVARARCTVAAAEVALAAREITSNDAELDRAIRVLANSGDGDNAVHGRLVAIRRALLFGRVASAEAGLARLDASGLPPRARALADLIGAQVALRRARGRAARELLKRARQTAEQASVAPLTEEIDGVLRSLDTPAARCSSAGRARPLRLEEVEDLLSSTTVVIDACRRVVWHAERSIPFARRPVLFALVRCLGEAWPDGASRPALIAAAFSVRRYNETHRARLRVEIGRVRRVLPGLATIVATTEGYALRLVGAGSLAVLAPPIDGPAAELLALLSDGERWSTSALALALGASQRSVQRALAGLESDGRARSIGRGRAQRWVAPSPVDGFTTALLLASLSGSG